MTGSASLLRQELAPRWFLPIVCISIYAPFFFLLVDHLPEKFFRDTSKIELLTESGIETDSRSFGGTATFFHILPTDVRNLFIFLVGSAVIALVMSRTTILGAVLGLTLVTPAVMLSLFGPSKETIVFCISMLVLSIQLHIRSIIVSLILTIMIYIAYALTIRSYYLLLAATYIVILLWMIGITELRIALIGIAISLLIFLPNDFYQVLQGARDVSTTYLKYGSPHVVRTLIENPFPPVDLKTFLLNYVYALTVCLFPLCVDLTIKEFMLTAFNFSCFFLLIGGLRPESVRACPLGCLFLAHFAVLLLFEPDLGSYLRHISSAILYLVPAMLAVEGVGAGSSRPGRLVSRGPRRRHHPEPPPACGFAHQAR